LVGKLSPCIDVGTTPWMLSPVFTCPSGIHVVHMIKLHVFRFLVPCCDVRCDLHLLSSLLSFFCR